MTEEDISKAFLALGAIAGMLEASLLKLDAFKSAEMESKVNQIAEFMHAGAQLMRDSRTTIVSDYEMLDRRVHVMESKFERLLDSIGG